MDREAMSNEENYCFDVGGYLIIRGALTRQELDACNRALDQAGQVDGMLGWPAPLREPFRALLIHPVLVWYLNPICGYGFRLARVPMLIGNGAGDAVGRLAGGNEPMDVARAYFYQNGRRICQGVRAIWALADVNAGDGGFVLVPSSHKSNVETPEDVLTGRDDMELTFQPTLKAGDLLLCGETVLQGIRPWKGKGPQRLLSYSYAGRAAIQSHGTGPQTKQEELPEWMAELTPVQRAVLYKPGYETTYPPPTINSDGETCWIEEHRELIHPSIYIKDPDSTIDEKEFYFWDLCGYLVLRNVMTLEHLRRANEAIDRFEHQIVVGEELSGGSKSLAGTGRPLLGGLLQLPKPYCDPFREIIAHPAVVQRMNWMGGSGFRCGGPTAFCAVKGTSGHSLHDSNEPLYPPMGNFFQNGRSYTQAITVAWQLRDVTQADGGFACVPGSHKAKYRMPPGIRTCDDDIGLVKHVEMKAGDVLFFMDGSLTHGALAWKSEIPRRALLIKYSSRHFNRSGGEMVHPEPRWGDLIEGMSDAQLAVMRGADRDALSHNVPRLIVSNGRVKVSYERGGALYSKEAPTGPVAKKG
ncbi:phytanoyl-CoA dioxygenase family protein [Candidatus Poribacteria bacterium]|nr:phytanoyl-CoA dioxygenase family protein [Candidatus Poribacteria bacterium]